MVITITEKQAIELAEAYAQKIRSGEVKAEKIQGLWKPNISYCSYPECHFHCEDQRELYLHEGNHPAQKPKKHFKYSHGKIIKKKKT